MIAFEVNDMSCGHCVGAITQAVQDADPGAQVEVDLASHRVKIQPAAADETVLADAIREAGYTPQPLPAGA
jgi:copper chaperone